MPKKRRITKSYFNYFYDKLEWMLKNNIVFKHSLSESDIDDYLDIAQRGLLYCMIHFDQRYHCSMTTFVYAYVEQHVRNQKRDDLKARSVETDSLPIERSYTEDLDLKILVEELLDKLSDIEREVVRQKWFENQTLEEIAENIGMSRARVGQISQRAMSKMKDMLPDNLSEVLA